jgi:hypothetical protein
MSDFGPVQAVDGFSQGIATRVAHAAYRGFDAGFSQSVGRYSESTRTARREAMMDKSVLASNDGKRQRQAGTHSPVPR